MIVCFTPFFLVYKLTRQENRIHQAEGTVAGHYTLWASLDDLAIIAGLRILSGIVGLIVSYETGFVRPEFTFDLHHPNGDKKSREELEMEALEEPFWPWFKRFVSRPAFFCEVFCVVTQIWAIVKCLARLDVEVGRYQDAKPSHPLFWVAAAFSSLASVVEISFIDSMSQRAAQYGEKCMQASQATFFRRVGSHLSIPLLSDDQQEEELAPADDDPEQAPGDGESPSPTIEVGASGITADASYKAGWSDLLKVCYPDLHYIICAFIFLLLAAVAQVYIPRFTGKILDSLSKAFSPDDDGGKPMIDVPGFMANVKYLGTRSQPFQQVVLFFVFVLFFGQSLIFIAWCLLLVVLASIFCGLFSAIRGSIFTVVGVSEFFSRMPKQTGETYHTTN